MSLRLAIFMVSLLSTVTTAMSQANDDRLTLEQLVRQSDLIVVVSKTVPFTSVRKKRTSLWPWKPPFEVRYHHYSVGKVLFCTSREEVPVMEAGRQLKVRMADYSRKLTVHKLYHNKGIRKIPVYQHYESGINPAEAEQLIIFCQYKAEGKVFEYTVQGACESLPAEGEIRKILER